MGERDRVFQTSAEMEELLTALFSHKRGEKTGLAAMHEIDRQQNHLHRQFCSIHVGGTNGKGSVCFKIGAALQKAGYKVGLYTSPHLFSFNERIQVNGCPIPESAILRLLPPIMNMAKASFFDYTTALAFAYFAEEKVDYAVIEVGIGGRFDSTNVIQPVLSVITSIDYDHTHLLGSSLEEIAHEKAGIIKERVPYILGHKVPILEGPRASAAKTEFYDEENAMTARFALEKLGVPRFAIEAGISIRPPCRFEVFDDRFVLDVAHNPDGIRKLIQASFLHFPQRRLHFMTGFSADKDVMSSLALLKKAGKLTCIGGENSRLLVAGALQKMALSLGIAAKKQEKICLKEIDPEEIVIICGSFYLMAPAKRAIEDWAKERDLASGNGRHPTVLAPTAMPTLLKKSPLLVPRHVLDSR